MADEIKYSTSSWEVQQGTNSEAQQKVGSEIQLDAEPKVQQEPSKSDQPTKHSHPSQKSDELTARWFAMRPPLPGHIHNTLCPFWRVGDGETPRTGCPKDKTFTLFDGNPFTRAGAQHRTLLVERDRLAKERRNVEAENAKLAEKNSEENLRNG